MAFNFYDRALKAAGVVKNFITDIATTNNAIDVSLRDGFGNPISSFKNALSIYDSDVNKVMVNEHLTQGTGTTDTLDAVASVGDQIITVTNGTNFLANQFITLAEGTTRETDVSKIISIAVNDLTLDKPLENSYTTAAIVTTVIKNLNVIGSIVSPQIFQRGPEANEIWHIYRLTISMTHTSQPSDDLFGDLAALTNGLVIRQENGIKKNLNIWRDNGAILEDAGVDLRYSAKSGGGLFGTAARWTFKRAGTVLELDGSSGDTINAIVQDSLTGLSSIEIKIQGHVEGV